MGRTLAVVALMGLAACKKEAEVAPRAPAATPTPDPELPRGTRAKGGGLERWAAPMQKPDEVTVHVLGNGLIPGVFEPKPDDVVVDDWISAERVVADAALRAEIDALLKDESATWKYLRPPSPLLCAFHADVAIVWKQGTDARTAVFCFSCGQIAGNSGIDGYDLKRVAAFAAKVFPARKAYHRAAEGKPPYE